MPLHEVLVSVEQLYWKRVEAASPAEAAAIAEQDPAGGLDTGTAEGRVHVESITSVEGGDDAAS